MIETRTSDPTRLQFSVKSLVGRRAVSNMTLLNMARLNVVRRRVTWLRTRLLSVVMRDVGRLDVRVLVNRLRVLFNVMLPAALTNLVEASSDKVQNTKEFSTKTLRVCEVVTYVLIIARMKVPQGKLQLSSVVLGSFWKTPEIPCAS